MEIDMTYRHTGYNQAVRDAVQNLLDQSQDLACIKSRYRYIGVDDGGEVWGYAIKPEPISRSGNIYFDGIGDKRKLGYVDEVLVDKIVLFDLGEFNLDETATQDQPPQRANDILKTAMDTMVERGKTYDTEGVGAERSMTKVVEMFNALTGHNVTVAQGWKFMCCLKLARSEQGEHKLDNYVDGAAYFALAGEKADEK